MAKAYRKAKNMVFGEGDMRIMSVGPSGVGKSTIGNALLSIKKKDANYLNAAASAISCTQEPFTVTSSDGKLTYTDVPGIPDTDPTKTKKFYNMVINEAKDSCSAVFFVFGVDLRMDKATKDRIKQCALLFHEINKCNAAKILILNDMRAWSNPDDLDEDGDEYKKDKAIYDEVRKKAQLAYEQDIKKATGIDFYCTKVLYGVKKMNKGNMNETLKYLKYTLQSFKCQTSPHLQSFEDLEQEVNDARDNQDYEKRLIHEKKETIERLEYHIQNLKITIASSGATAATAATVSGVAAFFTFGTSVLVGGSVAAVAAATGASATICLAMKEKELTAAKSEINEENLKDAVEAYKKRHNRFEILKKGMEL